jgi:hypothetical protein
MTMFLRPVPLAVLGTLLVIGCSQGTSPTLTLPTSVPSVASSSAGDGTPAAFQLAERGAPTFQPAKTICEIEGGVFFQGVSSYGCDSFNAGARHTSARALCEHAYGGVFVANIDGSYFCKLP